MRYFLNKRIDIYQIWVDISLWQVKDVLQFIGDLDPIFKVIVLCVGFLLNQWTVFLQTYIAIPLGRA